MENKLIIAAAGAGKTTHIVKEALSIVTTGRVLITTFTDANELEIRKRIINCCGCIPPHIVVQPWFSFLMQHGVRPFQSFLIDQKITGLALVNTQSAPRTKQTDIRRHYFNGDMKIYSDKLSKFVCKVNEASDGRVLNRIDEIFSYIFIDEIQDMAGYDLELLHLLFKIASKVTMVGDPRQVTYHTHNEALNSAYKDGRIEAYIEEKCKDVQVTVDTISLNTTHRNCEPICNFANSIYPNYVACQSDAPKADAKCGIFWVRPCDVDDYLLKYHPMQLRDRATVQVNPDYEAMNYGASKGLSFDHVLIYPTKNIVSWLKNHHSELPFQSRSKLYVAVTRARYSVTFVVDEKNGTEIPSLSQISAKD